MVVALLSVEVCHFLHLTAFITTMSSITFQAIDCEIFVCSRLLFLLVLFFLGSIASCGFQASVV